MVSSEELSDIVFNAIFRKKIWFSLAILQPTWPCKKKSNKKKGWKKKPELKGQIKILNSRFFGGELGVMFC